MRRRCSWHPAPWQLGCSASAPCSSSRKGTLFGNLFIFKFLPQRVFGFALSSTYFPSVGKVSFLPAAEKYCPARRDNLLSPHPPPPCRHAASFGEDCQSQHLPAAFPAIFGFLLLPAHPIQVSARLPVRYSKRFGIDPRPLGKFCETFNQL